VGGFVNITQTARRLIFCATFTAGGLEIAVEDGRLRIVKEGKARKFVERVEHLSFSAARSREVGQDVLYVTERCVFKLVQDGLQLMELAPGIDLERQIVALMAFGPSSRRCARCRFTCPAHGASHEECTASSVVIVVSSWRKFVSSW